MKKVGIKDATRYFPPAHNDCSCFRLQGQEQTGTTQFSLGCTHFLPGGGADFSPSRPFDTIYLCIKGEITITDKDGNDIVLEKDDSIFIAGDEGRSIQNKTQYPASMMVILGTPKA
jgi:quercetin dioxygenase-like cupin family protein